MSTGCLKIISTKDICNSAVGLNTALLQTYFFWHWNLWKYWSEIVISFISNPKICLFSCFANTGVPPETPKEVYFFLGHPVCGHLHHIIHFNPPEYGYCSYNEEDWRKLGTWSRLWKCLDVLVKANYNHPQSTGMLRLTSFVIQASANNLLVFLLLLMRLVLMKQQCYRGWWGCSQVSLAEWAWHL